MKFHESQIVRIKSDAIIVSKRYSNTELYRKNIEQQGKIGIIINMRYKDRIQVHVKGFEKRFDFWWDVNQLESIDRLQMLEIESIL